MAVKGGIIYYDAGAYVWRVMRDAENVLAELPVEHYLMDRGEDVSAILGSLQNNIGKLSAPLTADFIMPHFMYGVDFITLPSIKKSHLGENFKTELRNMYKNYDELVFLSNEIYSAKASVTYSVFFTQKKVLADLRAAFAKVNINIVRFLPYGSTLACGAMKMNNAVRKSPCLILSLENNYGYIAAFGKDSLIGGLEIPFGIEALSDTRVMSERALYRDDSAELLVINARERAKSTKLTMAINIEDEKIDDSVQSDEDEETENKEENAVSVSEIAAINEENPELPDITKAGSENPDDDDDDDDEDDTPEARNVKTLNKSAVRVLPKFMRRPTPETPQGFVMENFRLFERRILLTAREMSLSGYMPKPDTVYMFLPQKMAFIADVMAHENPGLKWVNVADMSQKRGELALQGAQNFAPYKLPVF